MRILLSILILLTSFPVFAEEILDTNSLKITNAWARATIGDVNTSAVYMTITNTTNEPKTIVAVKTSVAEVNEIHSTMKQNGVMQMRSIGSITIPANDTIELKPGGLHIMLMQLYKKLKVSENIFVELKMTDGKKAVVEAAIKHPY